MTSATFRWQPGWSFVALALVTGAIVIGAAIFAKAWSLLAMLPAWLLVCSGIWATYQYRLTVNESGIALLCRNRARWTIPWSELREVTYQPGSLFAKNWDRLVFRTPMGIKTLTLDDRLSGRWSDPEAIKAILRARGYAL